MERIEYGVTTMTSQGQITIPRKIRDLEGFKEGDKVSVVDIGGKLVVQKIDRDYVRDALKTLQSVGKLDDSDVEKD